jgi:hypothetical protein
MRANTASAHDGLGVWVGEEGVDGPLDEGAGPLVVVLGAMVVDPGPQANRTRSAVEIAAIFNYRPSNAARSSSSSSCSCSVALPVAGLALSSRVA